MTLTDDARAILLLCGRFSDKSTSAKPYDIRDYNKVTTWLMDHELRPGDLLRASTLEILKGDSNGVDLPRIDSLLGRGAAMALSIEKWSNKGIWVLCRSDSLYPKRLKRHLGMGAPALVYGVGDPKLLDMGGVAVVGSRDLDSSATEYTAEFGRYCGSQGASVISGGARGADETAMVAALDAGGMAVGVLAKELLKASVSGPYRTALIEKRLVLISPYNPEAKFNVGNAMGRNKHIYSLADYALVISSGLKGGTWSGATEELKRENATPLFVREEGPPVDGNTKLLEKGARPMPLRPWSGPVNELFDGAPSEGVGMAPTDTPVPQELTCREERSTSYAAPELAPDERLYRVVLQILQQTLADEKKPEEIAKVLGVQKTQTNAWLKRAVADKYVKKLAKPVRYVAVAAAHQELDLG